MNPLRRSYEARVLVVPLGVGARHIADELVKMGLDGLRVLTSSDPVAASTEPIGQHAWQLPEPASTSEVAMSADMVVLIGEDLSEVSVDLVRDVCAGARLGGDLIAAVLVAPQHWQQPSGAAAMVALRQEVDMLVEVRGPQLLVALLDVLRGGARAEDYPEVVAT